MYIPITAVSGGETTSGVCIIKIVPNINAKARYEIATAFNKKLILSFCIKDIKKNNSGKITEETGEGERKLNAIKNKTRTRKSIGTILGLVLIKSGDKNIRYNHVKIKK